MKILVLDNDEVERSVIQQVLEHNGHEIVAAENSEDAMQFLREGEARFVIVDRETTDAEETQFIKRLREAQPPYYIYVLLIASKVQETDIAPSRSGADDYLHKPVTPLELKSRVYIGQRMLGLRDHLVSAKGALEQTAMFDPLTKVLNEKAFLTLSRGELERARRAQSPLSLVAIEIENYAEIAQQHGKEIAADALILIAQTIREKSRPYDGAGRIGENVFFIPLPGVIGQDAEKIAARILKGIQNANISLLDGTTLDLKLGAGVVAVLRVSAATEIEILIEKGREALAGAREAGDGQVYTVFL
ncbi:MAG: diguanylate cyclase [Chloroflexota bacterium]|jgi:two-component system chemotaxis response regulator CheY